MFEHNRDTFYVSDGISFSNLRFENDVEMYGAQAVRSPWPMQKERECRKYLRQNGYKTIDDVVKRQMKIPSKYRGNIYAYLFFGMED